MGELSFNFTLDQDGEEIPSIECPKCSKKECELLDSDTDLYKCNNCGNEFVPEIYRALNSVDEYLARAWQNFQERNFKRTIKDSTAAIYIDPENRKAYLMRGKAHGSRDEYKDAEKDFSEAIRIFPDYDVAFYERGQVRLHLNKYDEAIDDLTKSIGFDPDFSGTYVFRAISYFNKEDYINAIKDFSEAIKRAPDDVSALFQRGFSYSKIGELDKALIDFNKTIDLDSYNLSAYYRRGEVNEQKKNYKEAISDYKKFLELGGKNSDVAGDTVEKINRMKVELDPGDNEQLKIDDVQVDKIKEKTREGLGLVEQLAQMGLGGNSDEEKGKWVKIQQLFFLIGEGERLFEEGKYKDAQESFTKAIEFYPGEPTAYVKRSFTSYNLGDLNQSLDDLISAIDVEPYHTNLGLLGGAISLLIGNEDNALRYFVEGIHAQINEDFDRNILNKIIMKSNQSEIAIRGFASEIKIEGSEINKVLIRGVLNIIASHEPFFQEPENFENPVDLFSQAIQLDSDNASAYWCRGFVQKSYKRKIEDYTQAIRLKSDKGIYYFIRGYTRLLENDIEGFHKDIDKVIDMEPENTEPFEKYGLYLLHKDKNLTQAINVFSRGIEHNLNYPNLFYYRGLAYEKTGNNKSAISDFQNYIDLFKNGGEFNIEKVKERVDTIFKSGTPKRNTDSDYSHDAMTTNRFLAGLGPVAQYIHVEHADNEEKDKEEEVTKDDGDDNPISFSLTVESYENIGDREGNIDPEKSKIFQLRGIKNVQSENYEAAIENFTQAIHLDPENTDALLDRGGVYLGMKNLDSAIDDFSNLIRLKPKDPSLAYSALLTLFHEKQDWDGAIKAFTEFITVNPDMPDPYFYRGQFHRIKENWNAALMDFNKSIELDPEKASCYLQRGNVYENKGKIIAAISDYQMYLALGGNNNDDKSKIEIAILELQRKVSPAEGPVDKTALVTEVKKKELAEAHTKQGAQFQANNDLDSALKEYQIAINLAPNYDLPYKGCALIYINKQDWDKTISNLTEVIRVQPTDADAYYNRGVGYINTGKLDEAIKDYETAILHKPDYVDAHLNLVVGYMMKRDWDTALKYLPNILKLDPKNPKAYLYRANVFENRENYQEAIRDYEKYCELGGDPKCNSVDEIRKHIEDLKEEIGKNNLKIGSL